VLVGSLSLCILCCVPARLHMRVHKRVYVLVFACVFVRVHACAYVSVRVCVCVHVFARCIHIFFQLFTSGVCRICALKELAHTHTRKHTLCISHRPRDALKWGGYD